MRREGGKERRRVVGEGGGRREGEGERKRGQQRIHRHVRCVSVYTVVLPVLPSGLKSLSHSLEGCLILFVQCGLIQLHTCFPLREVYTCAVHKSTPVMM